LTPPTDGGKHFCGSDCAEGQLLSLHGLAQAFALP
jgi:hypothetical protein